MLQKEECKLFKQNNHRGNVTVSDKTNNRKESP